MAKQLAFVQYGHGKPPDRLDVTEVAPKQTLILHYGHERERLESKRFRPNKFEAKLGDSGIIGKNGEPSP